MTDDALEAAWAAVHDATPGGQSRRRGYHAAMGVARWRWVLLPMVALIAGCLPSPPPDLPASFLEQMRLRGLTFEVAERPYGLIADPDVVAALRADPGSAMLGTRAVAVFGVVRCASAVELCDLEPRVDEGGRTTWLVVYPDRAGADGEAGWVMVDATRGLAAGYTFLDPLNP